MFMKDQAKHTQFRTISKVKHKDTSHTNNINKINTGRFVKDRKIETVC